MAGHARNPGVSRTPAFAAFQPIRLRAYFGDSSGAGKLHVPPGAVARSAKVHRIHWAELAGIEDQRPASVVSGPTLKYAGFHGGGMGCSGAVAHFAGHTRGQLVGLEFTV